jgi:hypothetical protein
MATARACAQHGLRGAMGSRSCKIYYLIPTSCGQGVITDVEIRAVTAITPEHPPARRGGGSLSILGP